MTGAKIITIVKNIGAITTIVAKAKAETEPMAGSIVTIERDIIDAALAYRLGRKIMGKGHYGIVLIIAETLGALDLLHNTGHNTNAKGSER
jgi:hypothetical protein